MPEFIAAFLAALWTVLTVFSAVGLWAGLEEDTPWLFLLCLLNICTYAAAMSMAVS